MIFLVYYEWSNTKGNHAGMAYLARRLSKDLPDVKAIKMISSDNHLIAGLNVFYVFIIALWLRIVIKKEDKVFLMEYLARSCFQDILAKILRLLGVKNELTGLVHLSGTHLLQIYGNPHVISNKLKPIDRIITLGSSLTEFFKKEIGFDNVVTTFHYVESDYYKPIFQNENEEIKVLCMGETKRNFSLLQKILKDMPNVHFNICQGNSDFSPLFGQYENVTLYGFLPEEKLLYLMQTCDVNFSVMEDTIGSNVIVGGMATGMVMIVSDVGSIRDYCTEEESFLCKEESDFINAISFIQSNKEVIPEIKKKTYERSKRYSYDHFKEVFLNELFANIS